MRQVFPDGEHRFAKLIVPSLGLVCGESPGLSVIVPEGTPSGALIESERYAELSKEPLKYQWANQGLPVQLRIRDLTINGKAGSGDRPDLAPAEPPRVFDGIRLYAAGAMLSDVHLYDIPGAGLTTLRGTSNRNGDRSPHDNEVTRVNDCRIIGALDYGWRIDGAHSDGTSSSVDIGGIRGDAFYIGPNAGGWTHMALHCYASNRGIVTHGVNVFVGCQGETCKVGTYVAPTAAGSKFIGHKSFGNSEVGVLVDGQAEFSAAILKAAVGTAMQINPSGHASNVSGYMGLEGKATGVVVNADKTTLNLECWGGGTQLVIGSERPVNGCTININCDGADVGVDIKQLGVGNRIMVRSYPRIKTALKLPASWDVGRNSIEHIQVAA